jgi:hypothetical protein
MHFEHAERVKDIPIIDEELNGKHNGEMAGNAAATSEKLSASKMAPKGRTNLKCGASQRGEQSSPTSLRFVQSRSLQTS